MTQDKNHDSENLSWMEIAESDATNEVRHNGQRLPFIAAAVSLLIIGGGAVFAQTNNESPTQAEEVSTTVPAAATAATATAATAAVASMGPNGVPVIPNVTPPAGGYEDEDDDDEYEDDEDEDDEYEDEDDD
jgi:hypothetical protein